MKVSATEGSVERVPQQQPDPAEAEHFDVLVIGAGLSGIGAGCHLRRECPDKTFAILEARDSIGGTWDQFRYPGVRSDSDMFTLGYSFRPWEAANAIADGASILHYIEQTAHEHELEDSIRLRHRVVSANWSSETARWEVDVERGDAGPVVRLTCAFLFTCTGYYRYDDGYRPHIEGAERFGGEIVHPQHWPEDLDYGGKRVVVIGSGATAVTLVPAMAARAGHVTMLQRSPSYIVAMPARDPIADVLRRLLPPKIAYSLVRWKNVLLTMLSFQLSRRAPRLMKTMIRNAGKKRLPPGYDIDRHLTPRYEPWDQRLCLIPDGDLFEVIKNGDASIVTDRIESFTENGLRLASGAELEADLVVTATGLRLLPVGGVVLTVDGRSVEISETVAYKGMMLSGIPNLALTLGYTNASWTLKSDLVCQYVCRLLRHMDEHGYAYCVPRAPDPSTPTEPFINFTSGYVVRSIHEFPRQGQRAPWRLHQNYARDVRLLKHGPLEDDGIEFVRTRRREAPAELVAVSA